MPSAMAGAQAAPLKVKGVRHPLSTVQVAVKVSLVYMSGTHCSETPRYSLQSSLLTRPFRFADDADGSQFVRQVHAVPPKVGLACP